MDVAIAEEPRLLHEFTGRMRFHIPTWEGCDPRPLERDLRSIAGVQRAQVNAITGNVLVLYDSSTTNSATILARARRLEPSYPPVDAAPPAQSAATQPSAFRELRGRARIAVRGLDRDPSLARIVVERLERFTTVRAKASPLTGRVLVEYDENRVQLEDLISTVLDIELPELPGEDRPSHPLDPAPLIQSAARTVGAAAGLTLLAVRRLANSTAPPVSGSAPAVVASTLGVLQGYPATRNGLRAIFGQNAADLLFQGAAIVSLALSGNPLGLAVTGSESLRLLTKVVARRAAWRRYVAGLGEAPSSEPGTVVRLEAGARVP
ncbi:MAG: family hydrolase, partial [Chloroflexi bacterium]|nr:family hydrolase [Chloroflexota bacterium]